MDEGEKGRHSITTLGGPQDIHIVNEPGLYRFTIVFRSGLRADYLQEKEVPILPLLLFQLFGRQLSAVG